MKHTQEDILQALHVIKDVCDESGTYGQCTNCPFWGSDNDCMIHFGDPETWDIADTSTTWRAFR